MRTRERVRKKDTKRMMRSGKRKMRYYECPHWHIGCVNEPQCSDRNCPKNSN